MIMENPQIPPFDKPKFGFYTGEQFLAFRFKEREWLIDPLIKENDSVLLVGHPKAGKSLFIQQMIFSLTTGENFLVDMPVSASKRTVYVMLEGDIQDIQSRYIRMAKGLRFNPENFWINYSPPLCLSDPEDNSKLISDLDFVEPEVLIIDPLYMACVGGSLSDDITIRDFIGNVRILKERYNCTVIVLHHTHKTQRDSEGKEIDKGDDAFFGSQFLKAWPDHLLFLKHHKNSDIRTLTCTTQRSGDIEREIKIKVEQEPLILHEIEDVPPNTMIEPTKKRILGLFDTYKRPLSSREIYKKLELSRSTFHWIKRIMIKDGILLQDGLGKNTNYFPVAWLAAPKKGRP